MGLISISLDSIEVLEISPTYQSPQPSVTSPAYYVEGPNQNLIPVFWTHIRGDGIIPPVRCFGCGGRHQRSEYRHQSDPTTFTQMWKDCGTRHPCLDCPGRKSFGIFSQRGIWNKSCPPATNYECKSRKI